MHHEVLCTCVQFGVQDKVKNAIIKISSEFAVTASHRGRVSVYGGGRPTLSEIGFIPARVTKWAKQPPDEYEVKALREHAGSTEYEYAVWVLPSELHQKLENAPHYHLIAWHDQPVSLLHIASGIREECWIRVRVTGSELSANQQLRDLIRNGASPPASLLRDRTSQWNQVCARLKDHGFIRDGDDTDQSAVGEVRLSDCTLSAPFSYSQFLSQ